MYILYRFWTETSPRASLLDQANHVSDVSDVSDRGRDMSAMLAQMPGGPVGRVPLHEMRKKDLFRNSAGWPWRMGMDSMAQS